jgi:hypothetical protein
MNIIQWRSKMVSQRHGLTSRTIVADQLVSFIAIQPVPLRDLAE